MATWEITWDDLDLLPPTRDQGNRPACSMEAMMYSAHVINRNNVRKGILVPEITTFHHDSFRVNVELFTGTPLGAWWSLYNNWRVPTSLDIFLNHGVAAVQAPSWYGYQQVNISSYQAHDRISFEQIKHYVSVRHPVMVIIPVAPDFGSFPPGHIYSVNPWQWSRDQITAHMVMVYGCGMAAGHPYLRYLNTYGWWWGQMGTGRVYWNQVLQRPGTELVVYTMEMDDETVPVPPYSPRPPTPPPPDYPDSPHADDIPLLPQPPPPGYPHFPHAPSVPPPPQPPPPDYPDSPPTHMVMDRSSRKRVGRFAESPGQKKAKMQ